MVSDSTRITGLCIALAVVLWWGLFLADAEAAVQGAILLGVGVVLPTLVNEWRGRSAR
ncbi:hypothetical protein ACFQE1_21295 [Halobium palmae]|uniref:Uncharacterized protein n=1 Tax=Halobium palmae TaxID=1776492 RepID=A0ABD5S778_9EURY